MARKAIDHGLSYLPYSMEAVILITKNCVVCMVGVIIILAVEKGYGIF